MQDSAFKKGIIRLEKAFRQQPLSQGTLEIYFEKLKGVDDGIWTQAVEEIIDKEDFFPSIHCLLKYCGREKSYDAAGRVLRAIK